MTTVWFKNAWSALLVFAGTQSAWAVDAAVQPVEEARTASNIWGGLGWWGAMAACVFVGVWWMLGKRARSRNGATRVRREGPQAAVQAATPRGYSEKNVGNDASARPWEREGPSLDAGTAAGSQGGYIAHETLGKTLAPKLPDGFDTEAFLQASKVHFVGLQAAWDRSDTASLRAVLTSGMLAQIQSQLAEREQSGSGAVHAPTEVVMLEARLLDIEEQGDDLIASVEFSGLLREGASAGPSPFRELWNVTRHKTGGEWLVADVQALQ